MAELILALDLPGTKMVIGHGPQESELRTRFPNARFLGQMEGQTLAAHLAAADDGPLADALRPLYITYLVEHTD